MAFLIVLVKEHTSFFYHVKLSEDLSVMYVVMYTVYICVDKFVVKVGRENNSQ